MKEIKRYDAPLSLERNFFTGNTQDILKGLQLFNQQYLGKDYKDIVVTDIHLVITSTGYDVFFEGLESSKAYEARQQHELASALQLVQRSGFECILLKKGQ